MPVRLLGRIPPSEFCIDLAEVEGQPLSLVVARRLRADGLVHNAVQLLQEVCHVRGIAPLRKLLVDCLDVVVPLGVGKCRRLHQQRLEAYEHLSGQHLEASLGLVVGIDSLDGVLQPLDAREAGRADQRRGVEAEAAKVRLRRLDGVDQRLHALFDGCDDLLAVRTVVAQRVLRKRLAQAVQHAVVVDDQAEILARPDPVRPGDRLHQRVRLHWLVDVERREAFDVEAGQPHGADDSDPEGMLGALERGLDIDALAVCSLEALLHSDAMRDDVEAPFREIFDLVLSLADDDLDDGLVQPRGLGGQLLHAASGRSCPRVQDADCRRRPIALRHAAAREPPA